MFNMDAAAADFAKANYFHCHPSLVSFTSEGVEEEREEAEDSSEADEGPSTGPCVCHVDMQLS